MTEMMRAGGVKTIYVTDNPIVSGPALPRGAHGRAAAPAPSEPGADGIRVRDRGAFAAPREATERTFRRASPR